MIDSTANMLAIAVFVVVLAACTIGEIIIFDTPRYRDYIMHESDDVNPLDWWQRATFYQVYPRSFKDSDNDGNGDLQGITSKLTYLKELGVDAVWLSPIYTSPQVDGGYDISDYRSIDPLYGDLDDFKALVREAHALGLKVILDFVPNHTSDLHEWFKKSVNREEGYEDFYVWVDGKEDENGTRIPPNNWLSIWNGPMWEYNEQRKQYYLHQFSIQQPDLNYRSERVQQEMKDIMTYWLDLGVDGFRVDAVPHLIEDEQLRDEPINPDANVSQDNWNYLQHIYTKDQDEAFEIIYSWRDHVDQYTKENGGDSRIFMTEAASDIDKIDRYYGSLDGKRHGAHFSFNFWFLGMHEDSRPGNVEDALYTWATKVKGIYTRNWLTGNHDNPRIATKVSPRNVDGYNMLITFLKGVTITYMAEEIGQENGKVTCEQGQDPSAIKDCDTFDEVSRDFERTPFQWDNTTNGGFNEGADTWLPVSENYLVTNLAEQKNENRSHYSIYKKLLKNKLNWKTDALTLILAPTDGVLQIKRVIQSGDNTLESYNLIFNLDNVTKTVDVSSGAENYIKVVIGSLDSIYEDGDLVDATGVTLGAGDALIAISFVNS